MKYNIICLLALFSVFSLYAAEETQPSAVVERSLEDELADLKMPMNQAPGVVSKDKLYAYQSRLSELENRHEVSLWTGKNLTPDDHLSSYRLGGTYRYHINNRWNVKASYFKSFNSLSISGKNLLYEKNLLPASDFQRNGYFIGGNYHLFYGKFKFGMDKVHYFDHYIGLSIGQVELKNGNHMMGQAETGFVFWLNKWGSFRFGVKDEIHSENRGSGKRFTQNIVGTLSLGYLIGGSQL